MAALAGGFRAPFGRYWLSGFLADFGDGIRLAAFPLLAAELTRSPAAVAAVTAVQNLPWLLIGAGAGVLVDRTDRRRLMVIVDLARAALIVGLAAAVLTHNAGLALIYLTAFATGVGSALRDTAAVTCMPRLVEEANLDRANARMIAGRIVGNELAGPAAGGWLFGLAAVLPFAVNAGALGIAVLLLLTLPSVFLPVPGTPDRDAASVLTSVRRDFREGARWLSRHADIRDVTIATGVVVGVDAWWFAVLVLYVTQVLHQRPGVYGLLLAWRHRADQPEPGDGSCIASGGQDGLPARDVARLRRDGGRAGGRADRPAVRGRVHQERRASPVAQPQFPRRPDPGAVHDRGDRRDRASGTPAGNSPGGGTAGGGRGGRDGPVRSRPPSRARPGQPPGPVPRGGLAQHGDRGARRAVRAHVLAQSRRRPVLDDPRGPGQPGRRGHQCLAVPAQGARRES